MDFADAHACLQKVEPLVQCLTNKVVTNFTANALLAAGASPAMLDTPEESEEFAQIAHGVLINIGTPSTEQYGGMRAAIAGAQGHTQWVLDPVAMGGPKLRSDFAREVVQQHPAAIRGNASEIIALNGGAGGRGTESTANVNDALAAAQELAKKTGAVVGVSGPKDLIVDANQHVLIEGGHPLLQKVTGTGCALGALCAAYLGAYDDPFVAVATAHAHASAAGSVAGRSASAPGSFAVAWLDALYELDGAAIANEVTIK